LLHFSTEIRDGVVRFLSDEERTGLLNACKASRWPRLYALVVMAITTGARRGELLGLHWRDVDLQRAHACVRTSKNGEPKALPLVPVVIEELANRFWKALEHA
jgi:integrase